MAVSMIVISVIVSVTVMGVTERSETYNVDQKAQNTDNQKFVQSLEFVALPQTFKCIEDDLYADKPGPG